MQQDVEDSQTLSLNGCRLRQSWMDAAHDLLKGVFRGISQTDARPTSSTEFYNSNLVSWIFNVKSCSVTMSVPICHLAALAWFHQVLIVVPVSVVDSILDGTGLHETMQNQHFDQKSRLFPQCGSTHLRASWRFRVLTPMSAMRSQADLTNLS